MTRIELLELLVAHARSNGFNFRRWYAAGMRMDWTSASDAVKTLAEGRRYFALLFSHEFAESFWKAGKPMTFQVPPQEFPRTAADGTVKQVSRKGYTRRIARNDVWRYHLREMVATDEPLRYIRRFLPIVEELEGDPALSGETTGKNASGDPRFIVDPEDLIEDED